jgi:tyrosine-protein phosphatase SIW14
MRSTQLSALILASLCLPAWAKSGAEGLPNFQKVNNNVYRGGQPSDDGLRKLAGMGVKTILDLRRTNEHDTEAEARLVQSLGMRYVNVPMDGIVSPTDEQIFKTLSLLSAPSAGPVFIHCKRGADRTGTVMACYRMTYDNWDTKRAVKEAKSLGMSWTQIGMKYYLNRYQPAQVFAGRTPQPAGGSL